MDHTRLALSTCCISCESHKTIVTSRLECTLISDVTKILTQSVTSDICVTNIIVKDGYNIGHWNWPVLRGSWDLGRKYTRILDLLTMTLPSQVITSLLSFQSACRSKREKK